MLDYLRTNVKKTPYKYEFKMGKIQLEIEKWNIPFYEHVSNPFQSIYSRALAKLGGDFGTPGAEEFNGTPGGPRGSSLDTPGGPVNNPQSPFRSSGISSSNGPMSPGIQKDNCPQRHTSDFTSGKKDASSFLFRDINNILNELPSRCSKEAISKWKDVGPLNLEELVEGDKMKFDSNLKLQKKDYSGKFYHGQIDSNWNKAGVGRDIIGGSDIYEGQFRNNQPNGFGRKIFRDGKMLEGKWENGIYRLN